MEHTCLNCLETVTGNFCPNCGQKTDTHRITLKHFLLHDLLHGIWHLERGMVFTIKEALLRPGQAALDYIGGKRIRYYNVFYLCLLVIGLNIVLVHLYDFLEPKRLVKNDNNVEVVEFFSEYLKFILLAIVPIVAINAFLIFRRLKLNLAEHFILSGINLLGILIISILYTFFDFLADKYSAWTFAILQLISVLLFFLFPIWAYYNATKRVYKFGAVLWRILLFSLLIYLQIFLILIAIFMMLTGKSDLQIST
ncbi:MAG TPA: DUF3667 domain-containing protein [Flavobacterium sp.]|nr:DUF3667 domain-containing protein [Flavobacterium sp.]